MSNKYFIWKDRNCSGVNPEWLEITGEEFYKLTNDKNNDNRYFIRDYINPENQELGCFTFEVTKENFNKWDAARKKKERSSDVLVANSKKAKLSLRDDIDESQFSNIPTVVSFEAPISDEEDFTLHDVIAGTRNDFDEIENRLTVENLYRISRSFSVEEQKILDALYFKNTGKTDSEIAVDLTISKWSLHRKKEKVVKKLKNIATTSKKMSQ